MAASKGKEFEAKFKQDWLKTFGAESIERIYDVTMGFKSISNICDFIGYVYPVMFLLEVKSTQSNTWSLDFRQYEKLLKKKDVKGIFAGVVIWFIEQQKVCVVSISEIERLKNEGYKSVNCNKMLGKEGFENILEIPSKLKRTFLESDYTILYDFCIKKLGEIKNG